MENKNMVEISKIGECLLAEVAEMEGYQNEVRGKMEEANEKVQAIVESIEANEEKAKGIKAKDQQIVDLANEFEEEDLKEKILAKREVYLEEIKGLQEEIKGFEAEIEEIEGEFESLNSMIINAEYGKNILLAFGVKYGFLIKKADQEKETEKETEK